MDHAQLHPKPLNVTLDSRLLMTHETTVSMAADLPIRIASTKLDGLSSATD